MPDAPSHRLPRTVTPHRYEIEIVPDLDRATFTGTVAVDVRVEEETDQVVLHAADLAIGDVDVRAGDGEPVGGRVELREDAEQLVVHLDIPLPPGPARLRLDFEGRMSTGLRGFYRSTFTDAGGATRHIASTQFEATDARRAFPCWDEPDRKAVFSLTLVVPDGLTAIASGPVEQREAHGGGRARVRFADTMRMSTYILAWVIGPFDATDPVEVAGTPVRLVAPAGRKALTAFGLEAATHALGYLEDYFGLPYPGDKLDHVAVPDFAFGAMENLGCVLYRETALLADDANASQLELARVAAVVAHETAHMWFGNLVTMGWWNGIWLNEAFATFMELKVLEDFRRQWEPWTQQASSKAEALALDGLRTTRPVEYEVVAPEDADAMFDALTYEKGAAVLRMLEAFLGEDTFQRGITAYLGKHAHANTETTDLWDALEAESGQPVRDVMDSWILQPGYPVVRVEPGPEPSSIRLSQRPFRYLGEGSGHWSVPVTLRAGTGGRTHRRRLLLDDEVTVDLGAPVEWVLANEGGTGYYRTSTTAGLRPPADRFSDVCTPIERIHVLGDAWAEVVAGSGELASFLDLATGLGVEQDPDVWRAVAEALTALDRIGGEEHRQAVGALTRRIAAPTLAALGWDPAPGEGPRVAIARGRVIGLLGTVGGDRGVQAEAAARHRRYLDTGSGLSPDVLTGAVAAIAAGGGDGAYAEVLGCYRRAATPQARVRYLIALGGFDDPAIATRTLDLALTDEVRTQDGPSLIAQVLAGRAGPAVAWPWIEAHLDAVLSRFPRNLLGRIFESLGAIADAGTADRIHAFLADHPIPIGGPKMAQMEEQLDVAVALGRRLKPVLGAELTAP